VYVSLAALSYRGFGVRVLLDVQAQHVEP
jgi:hypothetical protein